MKRGSLGNLAAVVESSPPSSAISGIPTEWRPSSPLAVGVVVGGRYRGLEIPGRGGMASVARAQNVDFEEDVALKLVHPELLVDRSLVLRFVKEAKSMRSEVRSWSWNSSMASAAGKCSIARGSSRSHGRPKLASKSALDSRPFT